MNSIAQAVPEAALQAIRKLIKEQGFGPGDALPSQRDLAVRLGVSRASLREALSTLSALGVVSVQPGKGVFVHTSQETPGVVWPFAAQVTPLEIFQLRYALEGFAAGLAAVTLSIDELDSLQDNVEAMRKVSNEARSGTPAELLETTREQSRQWAELIRRTNIKLE